DRLPAFITVQADGFLQRQLTVTSATPTVDLIRDAPPFDLAFYRQFARGELEGPLQPLRVLSQAPGIYLQTAGLSPANVAALEQAARTVVPALTGGRFSVTVFETGAEARAPRAGWITVEVINSSEPCGSANVGAAAGSVRMNTAGRCAFGGHAIYPPSFAHELGHALGFSHVAEAGHLMKSDGPYSRNDPSPTERHHAAIAYARTAGNRDPDID
ncbi:MAG TPA: hypothetical protein VEA16_14895, partial [Vicinamibacterales bacterium]|nr:hypothetical protein [Vicinamibacterales bacterium]